MELDVFEIRVRLVCRYALHRSSQLCSALRHRAGIPKRQVCWVLACASCRLRLSDDDLAFINGELDAGLMAYFGFDFVNGSSAAARRPPRLDAAEHRRILSFLS